jgi:metal-responsive CopG/Arc/MetJ family transcriptional regulator
LRVTVNLSPEIVQALESAAELEGRSRSDVHRALLNLGLWAYDLLATLQPSEEDLATRLRNTLANDNRTA